MVRSCEEENEMSTHNKKLMISIHTATYNRGYILHQAYNSLKNQTVFDFEWVITDDGSDDNTEELVKSWIQENNEFDIRYFKRERGGIPRTLSYGFKQCRGEYMMMLDSDDYFKENAVERVLEMIADIKDKTNFIGVGFLRCYPDGKCMKNQVPKIAQGGYVDCTNIERKKYNLDMDCTEAYKTKILNQYEYPVWEGEFYTPEQVLMNNIAMDGYQLRWYEEKLLVCDYLIDGQTKNGDLLVAKNPMGFAMMNNNKLRYEANLKIRVRCCMNIIVLSIYGKNPKYILKANDKILTMLVFPLGLLLLVRRKRQFKKLLSM